MKKLNIGAGDYPLKGFINLDIREREGIDRVADARELPFEDNTIDEIYMGHTLEHFTLEDGRKVLKECLRVLKQDGEIGIVVPDKNKEDQYKTEQEPEEGPMRHLSRWDINDLKKECFKMGFNKVRKMDLVGYPHLTSIVKWQTGVVCTKREPKILIGIPTWEGMGYILDRFIENINNFTYKNTEIVFVDNSKTDEYMNKIRDKGFICLKAEWTPISRERLTNSRNLLREVFIQGGFDYLLSLEQDLLPPKDIIETLLKHRKQVVGAPYKITLHKLPCVFTGHFTNKNPMTGEETDWHSEFIPEDEFKGELTQVYACGLGCTLIYRDVLENIKFKWFSGLLAHDDTLFYVECKQKDMPVFVDGQLDYIEHEQIDYDIKFDDKNGGKF